MSGSLSSFKSRKSVQDALLKRAKQIKGKSKWSVSERLVEKRKPSMNTEHSIIKAKVEVHYVKEHCSFVCNYDSTFHPMCQLFRKEREEGREGFSFKRLKECLHADN